MCEKTKKEVQYFLKVGEKYIKETEEIEFFYELPNEDDYSNKADYHNAVRQLLLVEKSDAGVFGNNWSAWLPKYTIGEHFYWSGSKREPETIEEVAQHFKQFLGEVDIEIVRSTTTIVTSEILQLEKII